MRLNLHSHVKGKQFAIKAIEKIEKELTVLKDELTQLPVD